MRSILILAALLLAPLTTGEATAQTKWADYRNEAGGYRLSYPTDWQFKPPTEDRGLFVTSFPETTADRFRENLGIRVQQLETRVASIRDTESEILASLQSSYVDFHLIKLSHPNWSGREALRIDFTITKDIEGKPTQIRLIQQVAISGIRLYVATFTSESASYARFAPAAERMIASIHID